MKYYDKENNNILFMDEADFNSNYIISPCLTTECSFSLPLNLAVLASGNGSNFEALVKSAENGFLKANISLLVVNNEDCGAKEKAIKLGIKCIHIDHRKFINREDYDLEILKLLKKENVEGIVMAGWMRIVTSILINEYRGKIINIHPSLLPSFKGTDSIRKAYESGIKITGCTVHDVIENIDSGQIYIQAALNILNNDTLETITKKIHKLEHLILPMGVKIAANKWRNN
tara:strand:+ start:26533 stop:27222 length:690 start_codon:yes stop_codon:yes gene_type:complete